MLPAHPQSVQACTGSSALGGLRGKAKLSSCSCSPRCPCHQLIMSAGEPGARCNLAVASVLLEQALPGHMAGTAGLPMEPAGVLRGSAGWHTQRLLQLQFCSSVLIPSVLQVALVVLSATESGQPWQHCTSLQPSWDHACLRFSHANRPTSVLHCHRFVPS
jgi:hypothetical protein